jgi:hypothetical protein
LLGEGFEAGTGVTKPTRRNLVLMPKEGAAVARELNLGDKIRWNTSKGETQGKVVRRLTSKTKIKGHTAKPDADHPRYLVQSEKTGARAAHKPNQLKKS